MPVRIAHIINPVKVSPASDLYNAQPITFETMRVAAEFAKGKVDVELYSVQYPEDHEIIPDFFNKMPDLKRSVLDIGKFSKAKKLPLLGDVIQALYDATDAEYLVYTNVDIAVMPFFYAAIAEMILQGYDAFAINRRRVSEKYAKVEQIPLLYADIGRPHPGFDCFVFHRSLFPKFRFGNICLGIPFTEATMVYNLVAAAKNFKVFADQHLTIHIGLEVMPKRDPEYYWHNRKQFNELLKELKPAFHPGNLPYAELPVFKRIISWGLNPGIFIALNVEVEGQGYWNRIGARINELRFRILQRH